MEEGKKKTIMIVIIAACLASAIVISLATRQGGSGGGAGKGKMWIKCNNPDCGAEYQLTQKEYMEAMKNSIVPGPMMMMMTIPALVCQECGEESAYAATKCPNCGIVFIQDLNAQDYPDRCPECGISEMEERRNEREEEQYQGLRRKASLSRLTESKTTTTPVFSIQKTQTGQNDGLSTCK